MSKYSLLIFAVLLNCFASTAYSHARWTNPVSRSTNAGIKNAGAPCGVNNDFIINQTTFGAGESVTVSWQETVNHTSVFRIIFSPKHNYNLIMNDSNIEPNKSLKENVQILLDNIPDDKNWTIQHHVNSAP